MYTENQLKCALLMSSELSLSQISQDLGEQSYPTGEKTQKTWLTISEALAATIKQAVQDGRVSTGVMDCAKLLGCSPNRVMMCVLPEIVREDVSVHIQHTLIRSFCWENDIRLLMVKDEDRLSDLVNNSQEKTADASQRKKVSCMLIEEPIDGLSEADTFVCGYHDTVMLGDILPKPVIQLPE